MMETISPQTFTSSEPRRKRRRQSSMASESPREMGHMRRQHDTGSATFVGSGSGIHFVRTVRQALSKNSRWPSLNFDSNEDDEDEDELVPGEDDQQDLPGLLWSGEEVSFPNLDQDHRLPQPTFDDVVRWTRPYFESWHPPFPFLHAPTFLDLLETISLRTPSALEHTDLVIVRSVMSISAADRRQAPLEEGCLVPASLLYQSLEDALSALQSLLVRPSALPVLQAAVSIQLFLISMLRLNTASRVGGMIVRMSYHLGLHRCAARFPQIAMAESELRRRLFWSIYCIERYLSQALGQPLELKDDDLDVCFADEELHIMGGMRDHCPQPALDGRRLMLLTALARHGRIKGRILELRNKSILHSGTDPDEIARIDAEISKWWNDTQELLDPLSVDEPIMWSSQTRESQTRAAGGVRPCSLKQSHKLLLFVQKHELVMLLNRPVITSGCDTPAHGSAVQNCIGASKAIISHVYRHLNEGLKADGAQNGRIHDPLVWPGFVWLIWQSGLILLYASFQGYYSVDVAQRETDCCVAILQNLALRGNFWPSACAAAIKELQALLQAQTMGEPGPGEATTERRRLSLWNQQRAVSYEGMADGTRCRNNNSNVGAFSTDMGRAASRMETRSQTTPKPHDSVNRPNENSERVLDSWYTSNYMPPSTPHRVGMLSSAGLVARTEQGPCTETPAPTAGQRIGSWLTTYRHSDDGAGAAFNSFEDVFQLMDMPHTLNDPFSQAQLGILDVNGVYIGSSR